MNSLRSLAEKFFEVARAVFSNSKKHHLFRNAKVLTYISLLSVVPVFVLILMLIKTWIPFEIFYRFRIKPLLLENLAPGIGDQILIRAEAAFAAVNAGELGLIGVIGLFVAAYSLLSEMDFCFHQIWEVGSARSFGKKIGKYLVVIVMAPIFLLLSLGVTTMLGNLDVIQKWIPLFRFSLVIKSSLELLPYLLGTGFFFAMYWVFSPRKTSYRALLVGGLFSVVLWEWTKSLFGLYTAKAISFSALYGGLAVIPLFFIWIQCAWTVILICAELVVGLQVVFFRRV